MLTLAEAQRLVVDEWRSWSTKGKRYDSFYMQMFFHHLETEKSHLLLFRTHQDRRAVVRAWLENDEDTQSKLRNA